MADVEATLQADTSGLAADQPAAAHLTSGESNAIHNCLHARASGNGQRLRCAVTYDAYE